MTSRHLISNRNLTLLRNVDSDRFIDAGGKFISVFSGKGLGVHDDAVFPVGHL